MLRPRNILLLVALLAALALAAFWAAARPQRPHEFFGDLERPIVFAHQGGDFLWPSNTVYAFERAVALGADVLELDLHASSDGELVVIHDATVDRTTDGSGAVASMTLAELKSLDAGFAWSPERLGESFPYRGLGLEIPTLEEVFATFPQVPLNLEIKQVEPSIAGRLCQKIRSHDREETVLVGSFHDRALREFRRECPEVATSAGPNEVRTLYVLGRAYLGALYRPVAQALQVPETQGSLRVVTESFVRNAHRKGVQVHVWTPNEEAEMERLLALGVDGIITDRPDRLMRLLGRGGEIELPPGVPR